MRSRDFETVGAALLDTLGEALGASFTVETRDASAAAYAILSSVMVEAGAAQTAHTAETAA